MVFLALWRPTRDIENHLKLEITGNPLNYASPGATRDPELVRELGKRGWVIDTVSVQVGKGERAFRAATSCVKRWGHFQLGWSEVDPSTSVREGTPVVVTAKTLFLWSSNPLRIVYSRQQEPPRFRLPWQPRPARSFCFAHGCVQGHMLSGEESFTVKMDENGRVWYDILTFSRPVHPLAITFFPILRHFQKKFGTDSAQAVAAAVAADST